MIPATPTPRESPVNSMNTSGLPILIAGGGIGGLAAAIALAAQGETVRVLERSAAPQEASAGIQLGPNGVRVLRELGVASRLEPSIVAPETLRVFDGPSGHPVTELPMGGWLAARHGAPYWTARRSDLHAALLSRAEEEPRIILSAPFEVAAAEETEIGVRVRSAAGDCAEGRALVGADGLWSRVREWVAPRYAPRFTHRTAARALIPAGSVASLFSAPAVGLWCAPYAHVVHYPVEAGRTIAAVVVIEDRHAAKGWDTVADAAEIVRFVSRLAPGLVEFLEAARTWRKWPLFDAAPLHPWTRGRVTLLGDAAHPILPFFAQGGVLALEDALVLAASLARMRGDLAGAFASYEHERRPRAARVEAASRRNGRIYHVSGALGAARNAYLRAMPPQRLMAAYDWLYGWRPETALPARKGSGATSRT